MLELLSSRRSAENAVPEDCIVRADGSMECGEDSSTHIPSPEGLEVGNTYQFYYQPAMSMSHRYDIY